MQRWTGALLVVGFASLGLLAGVQLALAQTRVDVQTRTVMKAKLGHAQAALEGIAMEDFDKVLVSAQKLGRLAQAAGWQARQTPEYELFTIEFRRRADVLAEAAKERNVDGATLAYTQLTFSCVSCHKYMRGKKVASLTTGTPAQ